MACILSWFVHYMDRFWKWSMLLGFNFMWGAAWLSVFKVPEPLVITAGLSALVCYVAALCNAIAKSV